MTKVDGPRVLSLGGRAWRVTHIDWPRHRCYVEASDLPGRSLWQGDLPPHSYRLSQAQRDVLLGADPDVDLSRRAKTALATSARTPTTAPGPAAPSSPAAPST